jgi:hypothetical protein
MALLLDDLLDESLEYLLFTGNPQNGEEAFDLGTEGAFLFGRQKSHVEHRETANYQKRTQLFTRSANICAGLQEFSGHDNVRSITVPNIGGFAGVTYRIENFKVSLGHRADFFSGAIDGGIDARK